MNRQLPPLLCRYAAGLAIGRSRGGCSATRPTWPCRCAAALVIASAALRAGAAQDLLLGAAPVHSHSGQFVIHAQPEVSRPSWIAANLATDRSLLRLEPGLVAVSCERIKQSLYRELGVAPGWRGLIYVQLRRTPLDEQDVTITSQMFNNEWQYQAELPDPIGRVRYVRAIVQVVLLELANRQSDGGLAQVPFWLAEGLTQRILASNELEIILAPPRESVNGLSVTARAIDREKNPLDDARVKLGPRPALSFEDLSWPQPDAAAGNTADLYSLSAELFVGELLRLPDGRACLRSTLAQMPQFYNWQFAFLRAFQSHFERPLDVEKWWALTLASASGRDTAKLWPAEESWRKLDDALRVEIQSRAGANTPARQTWTLQGIIREWPLDRQAQALNTKLLELDVLRAHAAQDVVMLVQEYSQVLNAYVRNQHKSTPITHIGKPLGLSPIAQETIDRLDALDARRRALQPPLTPIAESQPRPVPATGN